MTRSTLFNETSNVVEPNPTEGSVTLMSKDLLDSTAWALTRIEQACCPHRCVHIGPGRTVYCCACPKVWRFEDWLTQPVRRITFWDERP